MLLDLTKYKHTFVKIENFWNYTIKYCFYIHKWKVHLYHVNGKYTV